MLFRLNQRFGTSTPNTSTKTLDEGMLWAFTTSQALHWSPRLHRAAHLSMNPPVQLGGGEHALPKTKQKHTHSAPVNCAATTSCTVPLQPPFQTSCPRLTSQPARSLLSLVTRCPPDTAHGRGQLNSHCSPSGQEFSGSSSPRVI